MHGVYGQDNSYEHCSAQAKCMVHDAWIGVRIILVWAVLLYVECWRCWKQFLNSCRNASHTNRNGTSTTIRVRQTSPSFWFSLQFFWLDVLFSRLFIQFTCVSSVQEHHIVHCVCASFVYSVRFDEKANYLGYDAWTNDRLMPGIACFFSTKHAIFEVYQLNFYC